MIYVLLTIYFFKYLQFPLNVISDCQNYVTEHVFLEDNDPWKRKFSFSQFLFSQFWRNLARKLMKWPANFIMYFQSPVQMVLVYEVLQSEYFFWKIWWQFQFQFFLLSTTVARKLMKRRTNFMTCFQTFYHYV